MGLTIGDLMRPQRFPLNCHADGPQLKCGDEILVPRVSISSWTKRTGEAAIVWFKAKGQI